MISLNTWIQENNFRSTNGYATLPVKKLWTLLKSISFFFFLYFKLFYIKSQKASNFNYQPEFLRWGFMGKIFCVIIRTVVPIFIVVSRNKTFGSLYLPAFLRCPLFIWAWKWFNLWNHFYVQIKKGHLRKAGGYSCRNDVLQNIDNLN